MTNTPFAADILQMLNDWNNATPEQRRAVSTAARQRANRVEMFLIRRRLETLSTPCEASDRRRLAQLAQETFE
jgi:hypothetical protein